MTGTLHYQPEYYNELIGCHTPEYWCVVLDDGQHTAFADTKEDTIMLAQDEFPGICIDGEETNG